MSGPSKVFDRALLRTRRNRAAGQGLASHDFLLREVAARLMDRLALIRRTFPVVLDLGSHHGILGAQMSERMGTSLVIAADLSEGMALRCAVPTVVMDEEFLPFAPESFDAVVSSLSLHWVNDLPGALMQVRQTLKPDGLFLAALAGGQSLRELRSCLMEAEAAVTGGVSPRISPLIDIRDMGALLQRAGFALPVTDSDTITVDYAHPWQLMRDLRGMGAANVLLQRLKIPTRRRVMLEAARLYVEKFGDEKGRVPATFEVIYAIGWVPHASQQQPLRPGSAARRLADALSAEEVTS